MIPLKSDEDFGCLGKTITLFVPLKKESNPSVSVEMGVKINVSQLQKLILLTHHFTTVSFSMPISVHAENCTFIPSVSAMNVKRIDNDDWIVSIAFAEVGSKCVSSLALDIALLPAVVQSLFRASPSSQRMSASRDLYYLLGNNFCDQEEYISAIYELPKHDLVWFYKRNFKLIQQWLVDDMIEVLSLIDYRLGILLNESDSVISEVVIAWAVKQWGL